MTSKSIIRMTCSEFDLNWKYGKITIPHNTYAGASYKEPVDAPMIWRGAQNYDDMPEGLI